MVATPTPTTQTASDSSNIYSPEYIEYMRRWAQNLMQNKQRVYPYGPLNAAADALHSAFGAYLARQANQQEQQSIAQKRQAAQTALGGQQTPPMPTTGGTSNTGAPFTQAPPQKGADQDLVPPPQPKQANQDQSSKDQTPQSSQGQPQPLGSPTKTPPGPQPRPLPAQGQDLQAALSPQTSKTTSNSTTQQGAPPDINKSVDIKGTIHDPNYIDSNDPDAKIKKLINDTQGVIQAYNEHLTKTPGLDTTQPLRVASLDPNLGFGMLAKGVEDQSKNDTENMPSMGINTGRPNPANIVPKGEQPTSAQPEVGKSNDSTIKKPQAPPNKARLTPNQIAMFSPEIGGVPQEQDTSRPFQPPMNTTFSPRGENAPPALIPQAPPQPQRVAQNIPNSPFGNSPLPSGALQEEMARTLPLMINSNRSSGPADMQGYVNLREELMPHYSVDPSTGFYRIDEPGRPPVLMSPSGQISAFPPPVANIPNVPAGGYSTRWNPATGRWERTFVIPHVGGQPTGNQQEPQRAPIRENVPPTLAPQLLPSQTKGATASNSAVAQAFPPPISGNPNVATAPLPQAQTTQTAATQTPRASDLAAQTPSSPVVPSNIPSQGVQTAELTPQEFTKTASDLGDKLTKLAEGKSPTAAPQDPYKAQNLDTHSPPPSVWGAYLDEAAKNPKEQLGENVQAPVPWPTDNSPQSIARYLNYGALSDAYKQIVTATGQAEAKKYSDFEDATRNTGIQAIKQQPAIKEAIYVLNNAQRLGLEQGPWAERITNVKALTGEIARLATSWGDDKTFKSALGQDAGQWLSNLKSWAQGSHVGDANQVLTKFMAALALENLRGMLGPNSGQFRQYEMQLMKQALGGQELSPHAQRTVMELVDSLNDRAILHYRMMNDWKKNYGAVDRRYVDAEAKFDSEHPTTDPSHFGQFLNDTPLGTAGQKPPPPPIDYSKLPIVKTPEDADKLPSGTRFKYQSNGKWNMGTRP